MTTISIVGTGKIVAEVLLMLRQEQPAIRVDAILAHSNLERASQLADTYGIPHVYTDYGQLLHATDSDFIYIANVNDQHYPYALLALHAGRNLIIEKPVCLHPAELDDLVGAALVLHVRIDVFADALLGRLRQREARTEGGGSGSVHAVRDLRGHR